MQDADCKQKICCSGDAEVKKMERRDGFIMKLKKVLLSSVVMLGIFSCTASFAATAGFSGYYNSGRSVYGGSLEKFS